MENKEGMIYILNEDTYIDEVGGLHSGVMGWNPNRHLCGECVKLSCKSCPNKDVPRDEHAQKENTMKKKSWKHYAKWIKDKEPYFNLNRDLTSTDKKLRKNAKKAKKFKKKWGFRYEHTWCLDQEIAKFVLPRLAYLRDNHMGYPGDLITERDENGNPLNHDGSEKWAQILNDMCLAFELIIKDDAWDNIEEYNKRQEIIEKGLKLFAKYYQSLWD